MSDAGKKPINSFNNTAILFHWVIAFLLMVQFLIGVDMVEIPKGPDSSRPFWFNTHKTIGIIVGCLIFLRLYWRLQSGVPESPAGTPTWERIAANLSHMLLYFCMILMPLSGLVGSLFSKYDLLFLGITIPKIFEHDPFIKELMTSTHQWTAYIFLTIICVHILAAVKHLVIDCDGVFERMMPNFTSSPNKRAKHKNVEKS